MYTLGSGSDYTAFIQRAGITACSTSIDSLSNDYNAVYHSNYDSFYWIKNFADPQFLYHKSYTQFLGLLLLHFSDDKVLPYNITDYAVALESYANDVETINVTSILNFTLLNIAISNFKLAAINIMNEVAKSGGYSDYQLRSLNDRLAFVDRAFIGDTVTSGNPYYLHVLFAPSSINSYAGDAFPALNTAISQNNFTLAQFLIGRLSQYINSAADYIQGTLFNPLSSKRTTYTR